MQRRRDAARHWLTIHARKALDLMESNERPGYGAGIDSRIGGQEASGKRVHCTLPSLLLQQRLENRIRHINGRQFSLSCPCSNTTGRYSGMNLRRPHGGFTTHRRVVGFVIALIRSCGFAIDELYRAWKDKGGL
jgi:hypothetical protein